MNTLVADVLLFFFVVVAVERKNATGYEDKPLFHKKRPEELNRELAFDI